MCGELMSDNGERAPSLASDTHSVSLEGKFILVGETSVGKTCLMSRFSNKGMFLGSDMEWMWSWLLIIMSFFFAVARLSTSCWSDDSR